MDATRVLVLGAGKIGQAIVTLLRSTDDYAVTTLDHDEAALAPLSAVGVPVVCIDIDEDEELSRIVREHDVVVNAMPFYCAEAIATAACRTGTHYFDLTEDVAAKRAIQQLADDATAVLMPQCGLAPGFVSVAAADLVRRFDDVRSVAMRVGALPQFPTNALRYNLTWSTDGLINEYCNPCEAIVDGKLREVAPLEGLETFSLDGVVYEAFNTSGGLGTLCDTLAGTVENLDYKTIRYPGHRDLMSVLVRDLRLAHRRDVFKDLLEYAIPCTAQDVVLVDVTVSGRRSGVLTEETFVRKVYASSVFGVQMSAIQLTTAAGVCAMVDLLRTGRLPSAGFLRQEQVPLDEFLANRFGALYVRSREEAA